MHYEEPALYLAAREAAGLAGLALQILGGAPTIFFKRPETQANSA